VGLARRLEALERENERMRSENAALRGKVATLEGSGTPRDDEELAPTLLDGQVSRRRLLSKAGVAAAGLVVAGALTQRDIREAKAATTYFDKIVCTHAEDNHGAVEATNTATFGYSVWGNATHVGVRGTASDYGVVGIADSSILYESAGVRGAHTSSGVGVRGFSEKGQGVLGQSRGRAAVEGKNFGNGYGGLFEGGRAQLKLVPGDTAGRPSGAHTKGEIYMDSKAALFVCVKGGTPGAWRKVSTTAV
jgi:hypothetical protein